MDFIERIRRDSDYTPVIIQEKPILKSLLQRGLGRDMLAAWDIEWDSKVGAMRLPLYDRLKKFIGNMWRFPEGREPKYRYEAGFKKSETVYGLWKLPSQLDKVVLVEGPFDAIWAAEAGIASLAILGSNLSEEQSRLIQQFTHKIVLCFDNDTAGEHADYEATKLLRQQGCWVYRVTMPKKWNDIQEVPHDKVLALIESAQLCVNGKGMLHPRFRRWQHINQTRDINSIWRS